MNLGLVLGLIGSMIGVLGGAIGTYFSISRASGPRERTFMIKVAVVAWMVIPAFLFGLLMLPKPYNFLLWIPYGILLPIAIIWCNRRQSRIREDEAGGR